VAVVVDTANVPPDERFSVWSDVSAQVFEPLAVAQLGEGPFSARLEHYGLGSAGMYHMWADASSADRARRAQLRCPARPDPRAHRGQPW
jgi:hypothetical protein